MAAGVERGRGKRGFGGCCLVILCMLFDPAMASFSFDEMEMTSDKPV